MPIYYNKTRGPLPLELRSSGSRVVPPKGSIDIAPEDEGSASVVRYVKKGFLIPPRTRPAVSAPEPKQAPVANAEVKPASKPVPAPAPKPPAPAPKPAPKVEEATAKLEDKPSPAPIPPEEEPAEDTEDNPKKSSKSPTRSRR